MPATREDWNLIGRILLSTQGPAYADRLRSRAADSMDPQERARLLAQAKVVERGASSPEETMKDLERLHDLIFGEPLRRRRPQTRKRDGT
jgi:hypothetical protein